VCIFACVCGEGGGCILAYGSPGVVGVWDRGVDCFLSSFYRSRLLL